MSKGYVYLMVCQGFYKIGRSWSSPAKRARQLQTGSPFDVELVGYIKTDDPVWVERLIHKRFDEKRHKGEWFKLDAADVEHFRSLNASGLGPEQQAALDTQRASPEQAARTARMVARLNARAEANGHLIVFEPVNSYAH